MSAGLNPNALPASNVALFSALAKHRFSMCTPYRYAVT
eukprot:CAMPEP_0171946038 /NCGR_PEP_ID=MMETSP0993-20121228/51351_1 /TAXON_ID=483369 /ORGANISM="non described non described, Strain CCMP2098" /LENGTH=37 /DNA_ID= /DNA_START= /DNA_END= /DNA_ORIENTATION=